MWALVENSKVSKVFNRPTAITINDTQYPANIMGSWTAAQLKTIGIYEVVQDGTNYKDPKYYNNTNQSFNFASGTVTASYGTATALPLDDVLFTAQDETDGLGTEGEVKQPGIRQGHIDAINAQAGSNLAPTDWMVVRAAEGGTAVPSSITTKRAAVRTKANAMCTQITNAANVDALAALYVYVNTGTEESPVMERPLGEFPTVE